MNAIPRRSARLAAKMANAIGTVPAVLPTPSPLASRPSLVNDPYPPNTRKAMKSLSNRLTLIADCPASQKVELVTAMLEVMLDDVLTPLFEKNAYFRTVVKNKLLDFDQKVQTLNMSYSTALRFSNAMTALRAHIYAIETAK